MRLKVTGFLFLLAVAGCRRETPVSRGRILFQKNCAVCHSTGQDRKQGSGLAGISAWKALGNGKDMNDQNLGEVIRQGPPGMPPFNGFSPRQMDDLLAYLKTL